MVLLLMTLMVPLLKVQLLVMTTMMTMLRSLLMLMLLLKPLHQLMRKQDVDVLVEDLAALAGLQQPKRAVLDVPELFGKRPTPSRKAPRRGQQANRPAPAPRRQQEQRRGRGLIPIPIPHRGPRRNAIAFRHNARQG